MSVAINHNNKESKQKLNKMYFDQTGANTIYEVINGLGKGWLIFALLSIVGSTFSVYMDFVTTMGGIMAFGIALLLAIGLEYFRHLFIKGVFSGMTFFSRVLVGGFGFILLVTAIATHYRSLNVYEQIIINDALTAENEKIQIQRGLTNDNVKALVASNVEVSKGINNNYKGDDESIKRIIESNNELALKLTLLNGESNKFRTDKVLRESSKLAQKTKETLFIIFSLLEFFAVFSIISKLLLALNTDKNVKEIVTTMDKLETLKSTVYEAVGTQLIEQTEAEIKQAQQVANINHQAKMKAIKAPYPTVKNGENDYNQESNKAQIAFNANSGSNPYFSDYCTQNGVYPTYGQNLPISTGSNVDFSGCYTECKSESEKKPKNKKEQPKKATENNTKEEEETTDYVKNIPNDYEMKANENQILDLMMLSYKQKEITLVMFEQGRVRVGDRLVSKRHVKKEFSEDGVISHRDVENTYDMLADLGYIEFRGGFRSLCTIENMIKSK